MWTIVTYMPNGHIYARSCVVDSWNSDFSHDEFDEEYAFDGISKLLCECELRDVSNAVDENRTIIISRDGFKYYDNDKWNGIITWYNYDDLDENSLEYKNAKTYHDLQIGFVQKCFDRAYGLIKEETARRKRLVQEERAEAERKKQEDEAANKRKLYEELKKEFGE